MGFLFADERASYNLEFYFPLGDPTSLYWQSGEYTPGQCIN
jgi:hypothetical protein